MINFFKRLARAFRKKKPEELKVFTKVFYNWRRKTQKQMFKALETEVEYLKRTNPGFILKGFSKPLFCNNGSLVYKIAFTKSI